MPLDLICPAGSVSHKAAAEHGADAVYTGLYLLMGWLIVIAAEPLPGRVPAAGTLWLVAGGLAYTIGAGFFAFDSRL